MDKANITLTPCQYLLTEQDVAKMIGLSRSSLQKQRAKQKGLGFIKLGRSVRYRPEDVIRYLQEHRIEPRG